MIADFVTKLPRSKNANDAIWVMVNRLMKTFHFVPIDAMASLEALARLTVHGPSCLPLKCTK